MSEIIKIRKGLNINLLGKAATTLRNSDNVTEFAIKPSDFFNLTPKLNVKAGEPVKCGSVLFYDKYNPQIKFTSPVSGNVKEVVRGERRKILEVVVQADGKNETIEFKKGKAHSFSKEELIENMLSSGVWPLIKQRPYGIIANPADSPKAIFISGFDSAPLGPDYDFILQNQLEDFQAGIDVLKQLTSGKVHLSLQAGTASPLKGIKNTELHYFDGPHPAGLVGIQIHHIDPINKGDVVWTVQAQDVCIIGRLFEKGIYDASRIIALAGSELTETGYYQSMIGASIGNLLEGKINSPSVRVISGNVLSGTAISKKGYIGFYDSLISVIPEGDYYELFGWALPGFNKLSTSRTFFSWLTPNKEYRLDTNYHGGERALVMTGQYDKVLPMDILPLYLVKAILAEDIDKMEQLGIYEVIEEDLALCEYVCTSKTEVQSILKNGLELMIRELN